MIPTNKQGVTLGQQPVTTDMRRTSTSDIEEAKRRNNKPIMAKSLRENADKGNSHTTRTKHDKPKSGEPTRRTKKTVYHWGNAEVLHWLRKYHVQYHSLYSQVFQEHDLSGRALVRLDPLTMESMGITDPDHRADLLEHILRLRLKHEQNELKILQNSQQQSLTS